MELHCCQTFFLFFILSLRFFNSVLSTPSLEPTPSPSPSFVSSITIPPSETSFHPFDDPIPLSALSFHTSNDDASSSELPFHPSNVAVPAIKKMCDSTDYPSLCLATLTHSLKGGADIMAAIHITIVAGTKVTKAALFMVKAMAAIPGAQSDILENCKGSYDDALYNYQEAMAALPERDRGRVNSMLSAVITAVGDCEDQFSGVISPLAKYSEHVTKMTSNCLAIVSLMP